MRIVISKLYIAGVKLGLLERFIIWRIRLINREKQTTKVYWIISQEKLTRLVRIILSRQ
jgi:hypothetical protein